MTTQEIPPLYQAAHEADIAMMRLNDQMEAVARACGIAAKAAEKLKDDNAYRIWRGRQRHITRWAQEIYSERRHYTWSPYP